MVLGVFERVVVGCWYSFHVAAPTLSGLSCQNRKYGLPEVWHSECLTKQTPAGSLEFLCAQFWGTAQHEPWTARPKPKKAKKMWWPGELIFSGCHVCQRRFAERAQLFNNGVLRDSRVHDVKANARISRLRCGCARHPQLARTT